MLRDVWRMFQVHFKVGMGSFYTEVLDEAIGRAYFTSTRVLPFFTDVGMYSPFFNQLSFR